MLWDTKFVTYKVYFVSISDGGKTGRRRDLRTRTRGAPDTSGRHTEATRSPNMIREVTHVVTTNSLALAGSSLHSAGRVHATRQVAARLGDCKDFGDRYLYTHLRYSGTNII